MINRSELWFRVVVVGSFVLQPAIILVTPPSSSSATLTHHCCSTRSCCHHPTAADHFNGPFAACQGMKRLCWGSMVISAPFNSHRKSQTRWCKPSSRR